MNPVDSKRKDWEKFHIVENSKRKVHGRLIHFILLLSFREKSLKPIDVAKKVILAIKKSNKPDGKRPNMRIITEYYEDQILKVFSCDF